MVNPSVKELSYRNNTVYERYEENYKTKKLGEWRIGFKFIYDEKRINIGFNNKTVKEKLEIGIYIIFFIILIYNFFNYGRKNSFRKSK